MSKKIVMGIGVICGALVFCGVVYALQLLSKEDAIKKVFGESVTVVTENKVFTEQQISKIKERLNSELERYPRGAKPKESELQHSIDFYFAVKDNKKTGAAVIEEAPGKWGDVKFIIALDLQGTVTRVEVMEYQEKRGQPIARHSFVGQFEGKTSKSPLQVNKDITGISGATISSTCAAFAVKKAIILYEELYLN